MTEYIRKRLLKISIKQQGCLYKQMAVMSGCITTYQFDFSPQFRLADGATVAIISQLSSFNNVHFHNGY